MNGIFGGNFNPIHTGHLILAVDAIKILKLDKVIFIPTWISPFKEKTKTIPFKHRFKMLKLATANKSFFEVHDLEGKRKGISYTYDTLKYIMKEEKDICLLIGEDQAKEFKSWYRWKDIIKMVQIYVFRRSNTAKKLPVYFNLLSSKIIEISSTEIRKAIKRGEPVDYYLPLKVLNYINKHNLYKN